MWPRRPVSRWLFRAGLSSVLASRRLGAASELRGAELIITNGTFGWGFPSMIPRIHIFHGSLVAMTKAEQTGLSKTERVAAGLPWRECMRRRIGGGTAEALAGRHATVVAVSESTAAEIHRHYRLRADAIVPNGIDTDLFSPMSREQARAELGLPLHDSLALFAGRLSLSKGGAIMARACERAGYQLMIAGPTSADHALALGVLTPESLAVAYAAADCVLLPSLYEACSYVALEALACGVPLVATRVGSIPTLLRAIPEYDALCVRHDVLDLTEKLTYLRRLDTSSLTHRARGWVVEHNSFTRYAARWNALVDATVAPDRLPGAVAYTD